MSYVVRLRRSVRRQIAGWHLPDGVLVDVHLRLRENLAENPAELLDRTTAPYDGMAYTFLAVDRSNRTYGYVFQFHIKYATDEETLWVVHGYYRRVPL